MAAEGPDAVRSASKTVEIVVTLGLAWLVTDGASAAPLNVPYDLLEKCEVIASRQTGARSASAEPARKAPSQAPVIVSAGLKWALTTATTSAAMKTGDLAIPDSPTIAPPSAALASVSAPRPLASAFWLRFSNWIYIPPRFLDGVFRPPREDCSRGISAVELVLSAVL